MRGVGALPPPGLEDAELSGDLEHPLQQALLRATGQKTVSKLAEDTKVKARVGQLEAKKVLPIDPRPDRLSGLSIAQALAELHQRDQGQAPGVDRPAGPAWDRGRRSGHPRRSSQAC